MVLTVKIKKSIINLEKKKENKIMKKNRRKKLRIKNKKRFCFSCILLILIIILLGNLATRSKTLEKTMQTAINFNLSQEEAQHIVEGQEKTKAEINSKTTDWNLILVNKKNKVPDNYKFELTEIERENQVDSRIQMAITQMLADARKEGLKPYICSSYRSYETQQRLYSKKVKQYQEMGYTKENAEKEASFWVAIPRTSEHEIGLALDIVSQDYQVLDKKQEETDVQKWLMEHCTDYGFILRYPTDKKEITMIQYEPWHYRYVGVENAKFMKEKDYCLEEYIEYLKQYE